MKRSCLSLFRYLGLAAVTLFLTQSLFAIGEKTLRLGAGNGWDAIETRIGLAEIQRVRPQPVLALAPVSYPGAQADLQLTFDEARPSFFTDRSSRWSVSASSGIESLDSSLARSGGGAARFTGDGSVLAVPGRNSLFAPGNRINDFTLEFWLFPLNLENGEQILNWSASGPDNRGGYIIQRIQCTVSQNTLIWEFIDFFTNPAGNSRMSLSFSGSRVMPKTWSHHLIRFDSSIGLLEYLVDGKLEALDYASTGRREGGEVYTPLVGEDGRLNLGGRFSGFMDEFRLYGSYLENQDLSRFPAAGSAQTRTFDLGSVVSRVQKIEVSGGRTNGSSWNTFNSYNGNGNLHFSDHSEIELFYRINNTPYRWDTIPWIPVKSGEVLPETATGRYLQVAVNFYSSGNGETSPYLDELRIIYKEADLPRPPSLVSASPQDGAVDLSWRASVSANTGGYLIYFGETEGEYFGTAAIGSTVIRSPIDAGNLNSLRIEGLKNGTLYYFVVAAYDNIFGEAGEFSRETAARPLRGNSR